MTSTRFGGHLVIVQMKPCHQVTFCFVWLQNIYSAWSYYNFYVLFVLLAFYKCFVLGLMYVL